MISAQRIAHFQSLGVDVWVQRQQPRQQAEALPERRSKVVARRTLPAAAPRRAVDVPPMHKPSTEPSAPPAAEVPARAAAAAPVEAFRIRCFRCGEVFAAIAEDSWPQRRFLLDVARAMNGFRPADAQPVTFDWPQPGVDPSGAERAFRAFVGHRTRDGERLLICGRRVHDLLGIEERETAATASRVVVAAGDRAPDASAKKALWALLRTAAGTEKSE